MLRINLPSFEVYNENENRFITHGAVTLHFEHSLLALSKWESKWEIPFLDKEFNTLTGDQKAYYVYSMCQDDVDIDVMNRLTQNQLDMIMNYVNSKQTATTIQQHTQPPQKKQIWSSELMYYNIFANQIPIEVESWNINRLMMLLSIFSIKNEEANPKKKRRTSTEINKMMDDRRSLNTQRKAMLNSKG